jgi:hypothetical protein
MAWTLSGSAGIHIVMEAFSGPHFREFTSELYILYHVKTHGCRLYESFKL